LLIAGSEAVLAQGAEPADDFDRYILQQLDEAGVPGAAVVVSHRGEVLFARGYGFANVEWQAEATARTVFEIASVTKLFTALSAMMLVEDGLLDLDRSISRYIEETPQSHSAITARHLLTHTAGLESSYYDPQKLLAPAPMRYTVEAQLADLFAQPLKFEPGTAHEYADAGMFLLGVVIARSSGLTYEEFVRSRILDPAGMTQTSFIDAERVIPQRAQGYTLRRSSLVRWSIGGTMQALDQNAFAGILSTAWDLNLFHEALREGRLIGQETEDAMLELHRLPDGSYVDAGYSRMALGWWVRI